MIDADRAGGFAPTAGRAAVVLLGHPVDVLVGERERVAQAGAQVSAHREVAPVDLQEQLRAVLLAARLDLEQQRAVADDDRVLARLALDVRGEVRGLPDRELLSSLARAHLARDDVIRELTYTGRIFEAEEAQALGFVTRVCDDPLAAAMDTAGQIAGRNPDAIRADKQLLSDAPYLDREQGLILESKLQDAIIGRPNQIEAVMAEMEGRPAKYA